MIDTASMLDSSAHRTESLTDTPIFHALTAAATPIYHEMTTAGPSGHRLPSPPEVASPNHPGASQRDPMGGRHTLTLPLPVQSYAQRTGRSPTGLDEAWSWRAGPVGGTAPVHSEPPVANHGRSENEYRRLPGRHRLRYP